MPQAIRRIPPAHPYLRGLVRTLQGSWPQFALAAIGMLAFVTLAWAFSLPQGGATRTDAEHRAQCERDAGSAIEALAQEGVDLRTAKWQRERQAAIQACMEDFSSLRWLVNPAH